MRDARCAQVVDHRVKARKARTLLDSHAHGHLFAESLLRNIDHRCRFDRGILADLVLDVSSRELLASAADDVLDTSGDAYPSVSIEGAEVARVHPPVRIGRAGSTIDVAQHLLGAA